MDVGSQCLYPQLPWGDRTEAEGISDWQDLASFGRRGEILA